MLILDLPLYFVVFRTVTDRMVGAASPKNVEAESCYKQQIF